MLNNREAEFNNKKIALIKLPWVIKKKEDKHQELPQRLSLFAKFAL